VDSQNGSHYLKVQNTECSQGFFSNYQNYIYRTTLFNPPYICRVQYFLMIAMVYTSKGSDYRDDYRQQQKPVQRDSSA
jgi:hypothetical protein